MSDDEYSGPIVHFPARQSLGLRIWNWLRRIVGLKPIERYQSRVITDYDPKTHTFTVDAPFDGVDHGSRWEL